MQFSLLRIRIQFLSEAILLALLGGAAGVAVGVGTLATAIYAHVKAGPPSSPSRPGPADSPPRCSSAPPPDCFPPSKPSACHPPRPSGASNPPSARTRHRPRGPRGPRDGRRQGQPAMMTQRAWSLGSTGTAMMIQVPCSTCCPAITGVSPRSPPSEMTLPSPACSGPLGNVLREPVLAGPDRTPAVAVHDVPSRCSRQPWRSPPSRRCIPVLSHIESLCDRLREPPKTYGVPHKNPTNPPPGLPPTDIPLFSR
jgi:hypothetical protein